MTMDEHQQRYESHQKRKRGVLIDIMRARHSDRMFADGLVPDDALAEVLEAAQLAPSSCDRHAVATQVVTGRDDKALLGGLLVGGVGWIHRAPVIVLLFAEPAAYKAPGEIAFMPWLDTGFLAENMLLAATAAGLASAYCNPAVRPAHKPLFETVYGGRLFGGAVALGQPLPPDWVFESG